MEKKWLIFLFLIVGVFAVLIITNPNQMIDVTKFNKDEIITASVQNGEIGDHILGDQTGPKVTLIIYGDYQCPACAQHNKEVMALTGTFKSGLAIIFRHFPLPGHANALAAAAVAEAAGKQGKFWEMHNLLFNNYLVWSSDATSRDNLFKSYAGQLGLNLEQFNTDRNSVAVKQKINFDSALGRAHDLTGTPTLVLNGEKIDSAIWGDSAKFRDLIKEKIGLTNAQTAETK